MEKVGRNIYFILCFIVFLFIDGFFTRIVVADAAAGRQYPTNPIFMLHYIKNSGAAFNLLPNSREVLIILSCVVLTLIFLYVLRSVTISFKEMFFIALLSAGIAGNLHERIIFGYVRDFFKLVFVDFPVFNVSDIFINIGVIALIILILIKKTK